MKTSSTIANPGEIPHPKTTRNAQGENFQIPISCKSCINNWLIGLLYRWQNFISLCPFLPRLNCVWHLDLMLVILEQTHAFWINNSLTTSKCSDICLNWWFIDFSAVLGNSVSISSFCFYKLPGWRINHYSVVEWAAIFIGVRRNIGIWQTGHVLRDLWEHRGEFNMIKILK